MQEMRGVYNEFPAHAGMNRTWTGCAARWRRVPRTRGDEPVALVAYRYAAASSPHTRG